MISEARIREAIKKGEFNDLPGFGKPLVMQDLSFLPPELRVAYIILKNAGFLDIDSQENARPLPPQTTEEFAFSKANQEHSKESLDEKAFRYNVMMESRRRF